MATQPSTGLNAQHRSLILHDGSWRSSPYLGAWIIVALDVAMDIAGLHLQGRSVVIGRASSNLPAFLAILLGIVWIQVRNRSLQDRQTKWARRQLDLSNTARRMIVLAAFCVAASGLSHLSVAAAQPLIDPQLS